MSRLTSFIGLQLCMVVFLFLGIATAQSPGPVDTVNPVTAAEAIEILKGFADKSAGKPAEWWVVTLAGFIAMLFVAITYWLIRDAREARAERGKRETELLALMQKNHEQQVKMTADVVSLTIQQNHTANASNALMERIVPLLERLDERLVFEGEEERRK